MSGNDLSYEIEELGLIKKSVLELEKAYGNIEESSIIKEDVRKIKSYIDKIYIELFNHSEKLNRFKLYGESYIPAITNVINKYNSITKKNLNTKDAEKVKVLAVEIMPKLVEHFKNKYNSLFEGDIMDLDAEIKVLLKQMGK